MRVIDGSGLHYRELNQQIREAAREEQEIRLVHINGQRYIGDGISEKVTLFLEGVPGNDLGAFMNGPTLVVSSNGQDAVANTMNEGEIIIHGMAGDTLGYAMRGGSVYVRDDVGYRVGIHMKEYQDKVPALVIGGRAGDFFGEYMAGGVLILLGLDLAEGQSIVGSYCGTGMHGGVMYIRGDVEEYQLGKEVKIMEMEDSDQNRIKPYLQRYCEHFGRSYEEILSKPFKKLIPFNKRPYGNLYAY